MGEMIAVNERAPYYVDNAEFVSTCFYTGFNGPTDPGFAHVAHAHSSDPLTLSQATKRSDWPKWEAVIEDIMLTSTLDSTLKLT